MKDPQASNLPDADMQAVPEVLRRAGESAREVARRSGTPLIVVRGGVLLELDPETGEKKRIPSNGVVHDKE